MCYTFSRGHLVEYESDEGIASALKASCKRCGRPPTKEGHDACLKSLPGVKFACCGHGEQDGYIMFTDGRVIRGPFRMMEEALKQE